MSFPALKEASEKLEVKQAALGKVFEEAGPDMDMAKVKSLDGDSRAKADAIRHMNDELTELGKEVQSLKAVERAANGLQMAPETREPGDEPSDTKGRGGGQKSFGQIFTESKAYTGRQGPIGPEVTLDIDLKTLMTTAAGWAPEVTRSGRLVDFATRPPQVAELLPTTTTSQSSIQYMEETTFTNNAAEVAEGGTYPEAALVLTERTSVVRKIGVWLPVTDEQLEDEPQVRGYLNNRLPFMIRQRLDGQIVSGNGTPPNLLGLLNVVGIQTQAKGADPTPDAFYKAMTKIRTVAFSEPSLVVMHPNDWQDVRLLRTADGLYIWGNPSDAGPERIWGLPVAQAVASTENTGLVLDTQFVELAVRRGVDVQITNSHDTFFINGKQAIRADIRVALVAYRPAAICSVTGI